MFRFIVFGFIVVMASSVTAYDGYDQYDDYDGYEGHSQQEDSDDGYADYDVDADIEEDAAEDTVEMEEVCRSIGKWGAMCKMSPVDRPWYDSGAPNAYGIGDDVYRKY